MRSLHTPQQETNVAYNPGVSYRGGEFIAQGISQAGNAITAGLQRYAQNREESAALDMSFQTRAQPLLEEMQKFSAKDGQVSPAAGLVDKGADWHKFSSSQKKAFLADVVIMGDKQDRARRQQQDDDFRKAAAKLQQDQFTQLTSYQNEMQRLQALSTGATVSNINSEIAQRDRIASQDNAVGQGLAAYARSGTNLNPDFSYSDYANRGFGLGNATLPEASTPFTHQQRMERAMTTPGLGGRGSIQLQEELRKLGGSQETPLDLARISLLTAQAEAARAGMGGGDADHVPRMVNLGGVNTIYSPKGGQFQIAPNSSLPEDLPEVPGHTAVPNGRGGVAYVKNGELTNTQRHARLAGQERVLLNSISRAFSDEEKTGYRRQLRVVQEDIRNLDSGGAKPAPAPSGAAGVSNPTTQAEFDALPSGAEFINPATGQKMRKK